MKLRFWFFLLLPALSSSQVSTIRSVSSLPATCNPGGGAGGAPQDVVSLFSGGTSVLYNCTSTNTWTNAGGNPPFNSITSGTNSAATMHVGTGSSLDATGSGTIAATSTPFSGVQAGTNLNALVEGTGGSFQPVNFGRNINTSTWLYPFDEFPSTGIPAANLTVGSGGSITTNHNINVVFTFTDGTRETNISGETGKQCTTGGNVCSITATAPSPIPTPFTGYTLYARDATNGQTMQRIAGCVNITTNCTINSIPTTTGPPSTNAVLPLPSLAKTSVCPPNVTPFSWVPDANGNQNSNEYVSEFFDTGTSAGVNGGPTNPSDAGLIVGCRPRWFTDMQVDPPAGKNTFFLIDHQYGNSGLHITNQERGLWVLTQTPTSDSAARYGLEGIQAELDMNCNGCNINGSPDAEVSTISAQLSTAGASTNWTPTGFGTNAIQARVFRSGAGFDGNLAGISGIYSNVSNSNASGAARLNAFRSSISSGTNDASLNLDILWADLPSTKNAASYKGLVFNCSSCFSLGANFTDLFIDQRLHGWIALLNGPTYNTELDDEDGASRASAYPVNASVGVTGSLTTSQIASSWGGPNVSCNGGASSYQYQLVAVDANGGQSPSGTSNVCTTGTNPLTSGNPATVTPTSSTTGATYREAVRIDVYRISGPMATGKVGSLTCNNNLPINGCAAFSDTGLSATGTVPSTNTTGEAQFAGYVATQANTVRVTNDFTSAANTNLQTITGLTWNLDGNAKKYSFHCALMYSQATAAVSMQFGIQASTVAPNDISAFGRVDTSSGAASVQATGVLSNLATTTATSIVTFTPALTATVYGADLDGSIDEPANNQGQVINIMVQTSNSSDLPTVKKGSYCQLY